VAEELELPVEELEDADVLVDDAHRQVVVLVQVPVDVPPLRDLHRLARLVQVPLRLLDAVQEKHLEAGHAEEGHRDADLQVGPQVRLHVLPRELGQAVVQGLVQQLLIHNRYLYLLASNLLQILHFLLDLGKLRVWSWNLLAFVTLLAK
jgi:hypothetical protein